MKKVKLTKFDYVLFGCISGLIISMMIYSFSKTENETNGETFIVENIPNLEDCENLSLLNTSFCLRKFILPYYNFTLKDDIDRTWEDIKENGGDCYDYNMFYKNTAISLGFNATTKVFKAGNISHIVTIISSDEGYCLMDLNNKPACYKFKFNMEEKQ